MPRVKLGQNRRWEKLTALIWGTMEARNIDRETAAQKIKISESTLRRRKSSPGEITLEELRQCIKFK